MHEYPNNYPHHFAHYLPSVGEGNSNPEPPFPDRDILLSRTLWVAENGNDDEGERNNISKPFQSIEGALAKCQDGDIIIVCPGSYRGVSIGRRVTLFFLPESATTNTMSINADGVQIKAWGAKLRGVLGQQGYSYSIEGGEFNASVTVNAGELTMTGVTVKGASATIGNAGKLIARNCDFDRISGTMGAKCEVYGSRIISANHAIYLAAPNSKAIVRNSTVVGKSSSEAIVMHGALDISHSYIYSERSRPIKLTQSLRERNNISHSQLIGKSGDCLELIPDTRYPPLFIDSNSMNLPIPVNAQIEEGINVVNEAVRFEQARSEKA